MLLSLVLSALTGHAEPLAVDCETGSALDTQPATQDLCVSGTTDATCGPTLFLLEAGSPGLVDVRPSGPTPVTGTFTTVLLAEPPLATGSFDLFVDADCDGTRGTADTLVPTAVTILPEAVSAGVDAPGQRVAWQAVTDTWSQLSGAWSQHQTSLLLGDETDPVWVHPGGNPAMLLLWTADGVTEVALPPEAAALLACGQSLSQVLAAPAAALATPSSEEGLDFSTLRDLGYPFAVEEDNQDVRGCAILASGLAETSPLVSGLMASLDALEAETDNTRALRSSRQAQARASLLAEVLSDLRRVAIQQLAGLNAVQATRSPWRADRLEALAERVASEGWNADERELLALHGLGEEDVAAALLAAPRSEDSLSHEAALVLLKEALDTAASLLGPLGSSLDSVAEAHAPWAIDHDPTATLDGPYFGRVDRPQELSAQATSPREDGLTLAWDLDADGLVGDAEGGTATWTPSQAGRSLLQLEATDDRGVSVVAFATLEAESSQAPSTWVQLRPEDTAQRSGAGGVVSFAALADAATGTALRYTFFLDGVEQSVVEPTTADTPAAWDWEPDGDAVGLHYVEVVAEDPTGNRSDRTAHWSVHVTPSTSSDDGDGSDPALEDTGEPDNAGPPRSTPEDVDEGGCGSTRSAVLLPLCLLAVGGWSRRRD